jgi:tRNA dimethylallyltransferase
MQVYRGMDIGTAKPEESVRQWVDYRMIDICDAGEDFTVHEFQRVARRHIEELATQHRRVIVAGGSGLHFRAVVDPMTFAPTDATVRAALEEKPLDALVRELLAADPAAETIIDTANPRRVVRAVEIIHLTGETPSVRQSKPEASLVRSYEPLYGMEAFGVDPLEASGYRVAQRLDSMVEHGFIDEVKCLGRSLGASASKAVGYREFARLVAGEVSRDTAIADTIRATNGLVKRQRTFFRRDPRIEWIPWHNDRTERIERAVNHIGEKLQWTS